MALSAGAGIDSCRLLLKRGAVTDLRLGHVRTWLWKQISELPDPSGLLLVRSNESLQVRTGLAGNLSFKRKQSSSIWFKCHSTTPRRLWPGSLRPLPRRWSRSVGCLAEPQVCEEPNSSPNGISQSPSWTGASNAVPITDRQILGLGNHPPKLHMSSCLASFLVATLGNMWDLTSLLQSL